jgi:ring-1,2-phenylacetyl-CoA epoxidase subunit PaaD
VVTPSSTALDPALDPRLDRARRAASEVPDPELPVLTIADLGVLRGVSLDADQVTVTITPTYSGCPAMDAIRADIVTTVTAAGFDDVVVRTVLAPAWSSDWISDAGRRKLEEYGVAPPPPVREPSVAGPVALHLSVRCPRCGSTDTRELSRFGSTACKSLWSCSTCGEPFDRVKAI